MLFHTDQLIVTSGHDKTIILWEIIKVKNQAGDLVYKAKDFRRIKTSKLYLDIALTKDRFICRKGNPFGEIKIIKFKDFKNDLKQEVF